MEQNVDVQSGPYLPCRLLRARLSSHCRWSSLRHFDGDEEAEATENLFHVHGQVTLSYTFNGSVCWDLSMWKEVFNGFHGDSFKWFPWRQFQVISMETVSSGFHGNSFIQFQKLNTIQMIITHKHTHKQLSLKSSKPHPHPQSYHHHGEQNEDPRGDPQAFATQWSWNCYHQASPSPYPWGA